MYSPNEMSRGLKINVVFVEASGSLEVNRGTRLWQRLAERGVLAGERIFTVMSRDTGGSGYMLVIPATDGYERMAAIAATFGPDLQKMEVTFAGYASDWYGNEWRTGPASMDSTRFTARRYDPRGEGVYSAPEHPARVLPF